MIELRSIGLILAAVLFPFFARGDEPAANAALMPDEITAAVKQLGNADFATREAATQRLSRAGKLAIEPLAAAALGENLEVTCRAVQALARILETDDVAIFDAAEQALEKLQDSKSRTASRRAKEVLQTCVVRRWKRAKARFEADEGWSVVSKPIDVTARFGGRVETNPSPVPIPTYFVIGPDWKGGDAGLSNLLRMDSVLTMGRVPVYVVDGCGVTPEAQQAIQDSMQVFEFISRGKARLAISFNLLNNARFPTVSIIEPDAAEFTRENLKEHDVIVKYDGEELIDFEHLTRLTRKHDVGDRIKLSAIRNGELVETEVELTGWRNPSKKVEKPADGK